MSLDRELPLVSIVIVNYRFTQHIGNCLESLKRTKHPSFEVIVVDQLTSNLNEIISRYPWVKFLHFDEDIGVAASRNRGAEIARGAYLVFLDSDTVVHSSWLSSLIKPLEHDSKIACAQAKILLKRDPVSIYGVSLAIDRYGFAHSLGLNKIDTGQYDNVSEIFSAITACAVVDTNVFRKVGGFDERFHYWHEDLDLGWRIRLLGYRIVLASRSKIYHYFGGTREQAFNDKGGKRLFRMHDNVKNHLAMLIKNYSRRNLAGNLPSAVAIYTVMFFENLISGNLYTSLAILRGLLWPILHFRGLWGERMRVQALRRVGDNEFGRLILPPTLHASMMISGLLVILADNLLGRLVRFLSPSYQLLKSLVLQLERSH